MRNKFFAAVLAEQVILDDTAADRFDACHMRSVDFPVQNLHVAFQRALQYKSYGEPRSKQKYEPTNLGMMMRFLR